MTLQPGPGAPANILDLETAVPLLTALVVTRCRENHLRILVTKGSSLELHGLRPHRVSIDVDLVVHPDDVDRLVDLLSKDGWTRMLPVNLEYAHALHAVTLVHSYWPCSIDVHKFWVGVLEEPGAAFDALWENRTTSTIAGCAVPVPSFVDSAVLYALHELRGTPLDEENHTVTSIASTLSSRLGEDGARDACLAAASMLGAVDTAAPLLEACGIPPRSLAPHEKSAGLLDFETRRRGKAGSIDSWLQRIAAAGWRRKVGLVVEALAIRPSHLRQLDPAAGPGVSGYLTALFRRWSRWGRIALRRRRSTGAGGE